MLLTSHRAKYLVVGAHAVAVHAQARMTADLDVFAAVALYRHPGALIDCLRAAVEARRDRARAESLAQALTASVRGERSPGAGVVAVVAP